MPKPTFVYLFFTSSLSLLFLPFYTHKLFSHSHSHSHSSSLSFHFIFTKLSWTSIPQTNERVWRRQWWWNTMKKPINSTLNFVRLSILLNRRKKIVRLNVPYQYHLLSSTNQRRNRNRGGLNTEPAATKLRFIHRHVIMYVTYERDTTRLTWKGTTISSRDLMMMTKPPLEDPTSRSTEFFNKFRSSSRNKISNLFEMFMLG